MEGNGVCCFDFAGFDEMADDEHGRLAGESVNCDVQYVANG